MEDKLTKKEKNKLEDLYRVIRKSSRTGNIPKGLDNISEVYINDHFLPTKNPEVGDKFIRLIISTIFSNEYPAQGLKIFSSTGYFDHLPTTFGQIGFSEVWDDLDFETFNKMFRNCINPDKIFKEFDKKEYALLIQALSVYFSVDMTFDNKSFPKLVKKTEKEKTKNGHSTTTT